MNIKKYTNKKRRLVIAIAIILLLTVSYTVIAHKNYYWPFRSTAVDQDRQQDTVNVSPKNNNSVKKSDPDTSINQGKTSDQVPVSQNFIATITQLEQINNTVNFTAKIDNSSSPGTCVVTFTNPNDRPVVKQFDATVQNDAVTCGPLSVPSLEFSFLGEWNVSLRYYFGTEQVVTDSKVTIQ